MGKNGVQGNTEGKVNIFEFYQGKVRYFVFIDRWKYCQGSIVINEVLGNMLRMEIIIIK